MPKVLLAGEDFRLLATRAAVLSRTGIDLVCCSVVEGLGIIARESFDLLVLCHSLSDDDAIAISEGIRQRWPQTRILSLVSPSERAFSKAVQADATCSSEPKCLIRCVTEMLHVPMPIDHAHRGTGASNRLAGSTLKILG